MSQNESAGLAARIVTAIVNDLDDRKGMHFSVLAPDIQDEILRTWREIVKEILDAPQR